MLPSPLCPLVLKAPHCLCLYLSLWHGAGRKEQRGHTAARKGVSFAVAAALVVVVIEMDGDDDYDDDDADGDGDVGDDGDGYDGSGGGDGDDGEASRGAEGEGIKLVQAPMGRSLVSSWQ